MSIPPLHPKVVKKFHHDGSTKTYRGHSVICQLAPDSPLAVALKGLRQELSQHKLSELFKDEALLPGTNYHTTIFICVRDLERGENVMPGEGYATEIKENSGLTGPYDEWLEYTIKQVRAVSLEESMRPPYKFTLGNEIPPIGYSIGVRLHATPDTTSKIAHLRQQLAQATGIAVQYSNVFHVTLAYLLRDPTENEADELKTLVESHLAKVPEDVELPIQLTTTVFATYGPTVPLGQPPTNSVYITMDTNTNQTPSLLESFPELHIIEPTSPHTHTAILLHGRGSNGPEFAEELMEDSKLPGHPTLAQKLPGWRFVFPSSKQLWSTLFEEDMPAWFEAHSLTDTTSRQELQEPGIIEAVGYLSSVLDNEIKRVGGDTGNVVLGGISQGAAVGMWTLLCGEERGRLGGFVGASTWLPFAAYIGEYVSKDGEKNSGTDFVASMMSHLRRLVAQPREFRGVLDTPVFLGHGVDDEMVGIQLGRQARKTLEHLGMEIKSKEYNGAELDGHWVKVPEEMDDIARFLRAVESRNMPAIEQERKFAPPRQRLLQRCKFILFAATTTMLFLYFLLFAIVIAQRPSSISICDYYTQVEYGSASGENQLKLIQGIVALAFAGPKSIPSKNVPKELTGILNPGVQGGHRVDLMPFFNGTLASTNLNNQPVGINWLDDGGLTPLSNYLSGKTKSVVLSNSTNEYRLFGHFYTSFSRIFECSLPPADPPTPGGSLNLAYAHKFMSLNFDEVAYFIDQLTRAAEFYGFSKADAQALNTRMNSLYNSRCAPPVTFNSQKDPQLLSLCQDPSCPLAVPNSDCGAYANLSADGGGSSKPSSTTTSSTDPTAETTSNPTSTSTDSHKLSAGGIAGATIGSIAGVALLAAVLFFFRRRRHTSQLKPQAQHNWAGSESVDYSSPRGDKYNTHSSPTLYSPAELHSPKSPAPVELSGETNGAESERISRAL
ncbi:hypothetical protein V494_03619 [Pseudogymnoascus sp. VKM F-4513 (FW-928)]|nr:hypothetical protein V494_03619 [Pseudogymnoascus sp. VKM F-4513 (FW-928)]